MVRRSSDSCTASAIRGDDQGYLAFHAPRYAYLLRVLERHVGPARRVLDIGPSRLSELIGEKFGCGVDTLGFGADGESGRGRHYEFDLNLSQRTTNWRTDLPRYDVIVMAEVIEHLHTAPQLVLAFVGSLLAEHGVLILQTPNAVALSRRLKLLLGRHPYEMIRVDTANPGHFREYTRDELHTAAREAGLCVARSESGFYLDMRYGLHTAAGNRPQPFVGAVKNVVYRCLPPSLRLGLTMELRRRSTGGLPGVKRR
jgi:SAM-dependent methyltransferase